MSAFARFADSSRNFPNVREWDGPAALPKIRSDHLIAVVHGVGVSGYEQRHANNSELHCRAHPGTLAVAPIQEPAKFELSTLTERSWITADPMTVRVAPLWTMSR